MQTTTRRSHWLLLLALLALGGITMIYAANRALEKRKASRSKIATNTSQTRAPFSHRPAPMNISSEPMQTGGGFEVKQDVVASGGGKSGGGVFQAEDTLGQSLVGQSSGGAFSVTDGFWSGSCSAITVNPSNPLLPGGQVGLLYNQTFTQTGGVGAVTFSVSAGTLPNGLALSSAGVLSGTPAQSGSFNITIKVTDGNGCPGTQAYTLSINPVGSCPTVTSLNPTSGVIGAGVTITGTNLLGVTSVRFANNVAATITSISDSQIVVTVPAGAVSGALTISKTGCADVQTNSFTVVVTGFVISGAIVYAVQPRPVAGVVMTAANSGGVASTDTSNGDGRYALRGLAAGIYTVTPAKMGGVNGVSAFDAARAAQHGAGIILIGDQRAAADVNGDGDVTLADALFILRYVVGLSDTSGVGQWRFDPPNMPYAVDKDFVNQNYRARLLGEVTGNWTPGGNLAINSVEVLRSGSLVVRGHGFQPGLSLLVTFTMGGELCLGKPQLQELTAESFTARLRAEGGELLVLRVVNPDGQSSPSFVLKVE